MAEKYFEDMKKMIMAVEDDPDTREIINILLGQEKYEIKIYPDAESFRSGMAIHKPNLVILDVMLPDGNGLDLCKQMKRNKQTSDIPVLLMSTHTYSTQITDSGIANGFIEKPFNIEDLLRRVSMAIN